MPMKVKSVSQKGNDGCEVVINVMASIDSRTGLDQDMTLTRDRFTGRWSATIALDDFPEKESAQEAAERLKMWLLKLSQNIKPHQIKKLNLDNIFNVMK